MPQIKQRFGTLDVGIVPGDDAFIARVIIGMATASQETRGRLIVNGSSKR